MCSVGEDKKVKMEKKVMECLELSQDESEAVSRVVVPAQRPGEASIYDIFSLRGIRVDWAEPGLVVCTLKVPPRLTDRAGHLSQGAIANLVDVVGASVAYINGLPMNVSVDISISYMSKAKLDDELEITSKRLGQRGSYSGVVVLLRNKATGEVVAEGRHSMFRPAAKL
uniref:acyl-coenzyme A thioesterase 13-like n=1 Tax=Fragaria vesca subsp. vesca TaxID=101020 RepID=UPI0005C9C022|nr:PREDICTED: acyl-coenzyme A thioesterase 13-like [Fragaria vesca subsp. vesca]XP_011460919.1 PREDICTED: acyl-coenzyme A thioesterase 13-like [Fragaria vesca subsp. vesca]